MHQFPSKTTKYLGYGDLHQSCSYCILYQTICLSFSLQNNAVLVNNDGADYVLFSYLQGVQQYTYTSFSTPCKCNVHSFPKRNWGGERTRLNYPQALSSTYQFWHISRSSSIFLVLLDLTFFSRKWQETEDDEKSAKNNEPEKIYISKWGVEKQACPSFSSGKLGQLQVLLHGVRFRKSKESTLNVNVNECYVEMYSLQKSFTRTRNDVFSSR